MSDDQTPFEIVEQTILANYSASPGWIAAEVIADLGQHGWAVTR